MLVFFAEKLTVFATTKTGSTALHAALAPHASLALRQPPMLKHMRVQKYQRILRPTLRELGAPEKLETFALVRNPIEWLSSWYRYRYRDQLVGKPNSTRDVSFDEFIYEYLKDSPPPFAHVGAQSAFLTGENGQIGIDHLYQYEAVDAHTGFLENRLKREIETRLRNVSPDMVLKLDPALKKRLETERQVDFDLWELAKR